MKRLIAGLVAAAFCLPAHAEAPPAQMPPFGSTSYTLPVVIYGADGNVLTSFGGGSGGGGGGPTGSVTAGGTSGTQAQAVQGIDNGVPLRVSGSFLLDTTFAGRINTLGQKTMAGSTPVVLPSDQTVPVSSPALNSIDNKTPALASGRVPVDGSGVTQPADTVVRSTAASRSGTITNGGAAQQLMAANTSRRGFVIQNQSTGDLFINGLGAATLDQNSLKIPAGGYYESPVHHVGTGAVSIIGATAGQAFYAREF